LTACASRDEIGVAPVTARHKLLVARCHGELLLDPCLFVVGILLNAPGSLWATYSSKHLEGGKPPRRLHPQNRGGSELRTLLATPRSVESILDP
jgi:hypothetical protein